MQKWINECSDSHANCSKPIPGGLPTRLIDVGSSKLDPFLVPNSEGSAGIYAALSYCWGAGQLVTLKMSVITSKWISFPLKLLPPTLQDAIIICRKLRFQYI
jgi:hypothetical protein